MSRGDHQQLAVIGVLHYGLGPIGRMVAQLVRDRPTLESKAAVDADPSFRGKTLDELLVTSDRRSSPQVVQALSDADRRDCMVAIHCTGSALEKVMPQLLELVDAGLHVVSTCEELSFPWATSTAYALELDRRARAGGVAVLGTGVNPGFAMDYLPIVLSGVLHRVDRISVARVQNAATRRLPLQHKVGVGLSVRDFGLRVEQHSLGHVGLRQSTEALADAFGWTLDDYEEVIRPVIARRATATAVGVVPVGNVLGLRQIARGSLSGEILIELHLTLAVGVRRAYDRITLLGDTQVEMLISDGLHGDTATAALVMNSIRRVANASPGLHTMSDLAPPHAWNGKVD